jgi:glycine cleavage system regulatory protein
MYWLYLLKLYRPKVISRITNLFPKYLENLGSKCISLFSKFSEKLQFHIWQIDFKIPKFVK